MFRYWEIICMDSNKYWHYLFFSRNNVALETFRREMIMTVLHACIIRHCTYYVIHMILSHHVPCSVRCFMGG
jgi:hypothetical protein